MRWIRRLFFLLLLLGAIFGSNRFIAQNADPVRVDYLAGAFDAVPLWLVIVAAIAGGAALVAALALYQLSKQGLVTRRYRKTVKKLEAEVHELRSLPLSPEEPAPGEPAADPADEPLPRGALERGA